MAAAGLPLALLFGLVADLTARLLRHGFNRAVFAGLIDLRDDAVKVWRRERASLVGSVGAAAALFGAGLAAAGAVGLGPGSAILVYVGLALAAVGGHAAASHPGTRAGEESARGARLATALAEPAFVVALGAAFFRWRADEVGMVLGAQGVLGTGFTVGPGLAAAGLLTAAVAVVAAGAFRLAPDLRPPDGGGPALLLALCRWSLAGATALVAASLVAGQDLTAASFDLDLLVWLGTSLGAAVALGAARSGWGALAGRLPTGTLASLPSVPAAAAAVLVALG